MTRPGAIVVCGGESKRMGRPKALLPIGDERMIQRVVRLVSEVADPVVVVAAKRQHLPVLGRRPVKIVRDPVPGRGPLQGIAAGLDALPGTCEFAFATATDVPFLVPAWITRLMELIGDDDLAIPGMGGFLHPLSALYRCATIRPAVRSLLDADRLRPAFLVEMVKTRVVEADEMRVVDPELATLRNLNTPSDYFNALRSLGPRSP